MKIEAGKEYRDMDIAVIGMALKFPGADSVDEFWENLKDGKISSVDLSDEDLKSVGVPEKFLNDPNYVKKAMPIKDIDKFDPNFFGFTPNEAKYIDPQLRVLLEVAWHAIEDAGEVTGDDDRTGVFVGASMSQYLMKNIFSSLSYEQINETRILWLENDLNYLATMLSYKLNLRGVSVNVQSACSTSLLAVELACQSLASYETDMVLAGGVRIAMPQCEGYLYREGDIQSPDGYCRPFDENGNGTIVGNGAGVVVLKRLNDAIRDHNHIVAVIKGWGANNDGNGKVGYSAPSIIGEANAIMQAHLLSEVDPATITYIETHGTATQLGDPIEIQALNDAFCDVTDTQFCTLGAVKANIGHLDIASGIAGFIKTCLVLKNKQYPPIPNFRSLNNKISLEHTPFRINKELEEWNPKCGVRRAGVSSFGIGGTNVHIVLEEAEMQECNKAPETERLILFSAKNFNSLKMGTDSFNLWLSEATENELSNVAYTYAHGKNVFSHKAYEIISNRDIIEESTYVMQSSVKPQIIFAFPGQGSQYIGMGKQFYEKEKSFREAFDECAKIAEKTSGISLKELLYESNDTEENNELLKRTDYTHIALFTVEYACAKLMENYGVVPDAMIGHSIGEYVEACYSGVISLEDAMKIVAARGRIIYSLKAGCMLSIPCSVEKVKQYLSENISLAVVNTTNGCVLSGAKEEIERIQNDLANAGIESRLLHVSHAFHSHMMDDGIDQFKQILDTVKFSAPKIPYLSNVTGTWIKHSDLNTNYWLEHMRGTVRFYDDCINLDQGKPIICLEIGPGNTLEKFVRINLHGKEVVATHLIHHPREEKEDMQLLLKTFGELWNSGLLDVNKVFPETDDSVKISVPVYEFDNRSYWIDWKYGNDKQNQVNHEEIVEYESVDRSQLSNQCEEPENELEAFIKDVWEDVMGIKPIGVTDNFIEIGGHSLIASQIIYRVSEELNIDLKLADFMERQTIREVSNYIYDVILNN